MEFVSTAVASEIFGVSLRALQQAAKRQSKKYTYKKMEGSFHGGNNGVLLFGVSDEQYEIYIRKQNKGEKNAHKDSDRQPRRHETLNRGEFACDEKWEFGGSGTNEGGSKVWHEHTKEREERSGGGYDESLGGHSKGDLDEKFYGIPRRDIDNGKIHGSNRQRTTDDNQKNSGDIPSKFQQDGDILETIAKREHNKTKECSFEQHNNMHIRISSGGELDRYLQGDLNENTSRRTEAIGGTKTRTQNSEKIAQEASTTGDGISKASTATTVGNGYKDSKGSGANSKEELSKVEFKKRVVAYAKMHGATAASKFFNVPITSVYRWIKGFNKKGSAALKDKRGGTVRANVEKIKEAIFTVGTAQITTWWDAYCLMWAEENGEVFDFYNPKADISRATFLRHAKRLKKEDAQVRNFLRGGLDGLDVRPTIIRNWLKVNEEWQIDATKFDFMCLDENQNQKRYTAISIVDVGSRRRVFELYDTGNSYANVRLLKKAFKKMGRPEFIKGDNGKDYVSRHFQGVLERLGVSYVNAQPYKGWQKGLVERSFGQLQDKFELLPGFLGHNAGQRSNKEDQAVEKSKRLAGAKTNIKNLLTRDEMQCFIDEYAQQIFFNEESVSVFEFDERVFGKSEKRVLGAEGFSIDGIKYTNLEIYRHVQIGQTCELIENIDDASRYFVYFKGQYVSEAISEDVVSYTSEEARAAQKEYHKTHVAPLKTAIKSLQNDKDKYFKELAAAKVKTKQKQMKEAILKKEKKETVKVREVEVGNTTRYLPNLDDIEEYLG